MKQEGYFSNNMYYFLPIDLKKYITKPQTIILSYLLKLLQRNGK
jgi:hypothetical protein